MMMSIVPIGCRHETKPNTPAPSPDRQEQEVPKALTESEIETKALAALFKESSFRRDQLDISSSRFGTEWHVTVWQLPAVPGGFSTVVLSDRGEVKEIIGGE
jgi:hypothetical protein